MGLFFTLLACAFLLIACDPTPYQRTDFVFGTLVEITIYDQPNAQQAAQAVIDELNHMERLLHPTENSELAKLNQSIARGEKNISLSAELAQLLQKMKEDVKTTGPLFNPAIGNLIGLWGFYQDGDGKQVPSKEEIHDFLIASPTMDDLQIQNNTLHVRNSHVALDLGGYAKGMALDRAKNILKSYGIHNALVNIGGNVLALGKKGEQPWVVGIRDPRANRAFAVIALHDGEAIGTSGDYQRFFMLNQQRYHHILDPRSGYPAKEVISATIVINNNEQAGKLSDMLSKPFFIAGITSYQTLCQQIKMPMLIFVDQQGTVFLSRQIKTRLTLLDMQKTLKLLPECVTNQ